MTNCFPLVSPRNCGWWRGETKAFRLAVSIPRPFPHRRCRQTVLPSWHPPPSSTSRPMIGFPDASAASPSGCSHPPLPLRPAPASIPFRIHIAKPPHLCARLTIRRRSGSTALQAEHRRAHGGCGPGAAARGGRAGRRVALVQMAKQPRLPSPRLLRSSLGQAASWRTNSTAARL